MKQSHTLRSDVSMNASNGMGTDLYELFDALIFRWVDELKMSSPNERYTDNPSVDALAFIKRGWKGQFLKLGGIEGQSENLVGHEYSGESRMRAKGRNLLNPGDFFLKMRKEMSDFKIHFNT